MAMNNKGQLLLYAVMIAIFVLIFAVIVTKPIKDMITISRDSEHLDCANASISTGTKLTCLIVDLYLPYFIGAILAASVAYMFTRRRGD